MSLTIKNLKDLVIEKVNNAAIKSEYQSYKLILVAVPQHLHCALEIELLSSSISMINLSKQLSRKLVSQSVNQRAHRLQEEVSEITKSCKTSVWLSKIDILFETSLQCDPIMLLKSIAKSQVLVVIWPGEIVENSMVYSKPGKQDYKSYPLKNLKDLQVIDTCNGVLR